MITKQTFCQHLMQKFARENEMKVADITESHILSSSSLAVAMETLGLLKTEDMIEYASGRGGIFISPMPVLDEEGNFLGAEYLTVRELLAMLPDEVDLSQN